MTDQSEVGEQAMGAPVLRPFAHKQGRGDFNSIALINIILIATIVFLAIIGLLFITGKIAPNCGASFFVSGFAYVFVIIAMRRIWLQGYAGLSLYENGILVSYSPKSRYFISFKEMERIVINPSQKTARKVAKAQMFNQGIRWFDGNDEGWKYPSHRLNYEMTYAERSVIIFTKPGVLETDQFLIYIPNILDIDKFRNLSETLAAKHGVSVIDEKGVVSLKPADFWDRWNSMFFPVDYIRYRLPYGTPEFEREYGKVVFPNNSKFRTGPIKLLPILVVLFISMVILIRMPFSWDWTLFEPYKSTLKLVEFILLGTFFGLFITGPGSKLVAFRKSSIYDTGIMLPHTFAGDMDFLFFRNVEYVVINPTKKTAYDIVERTSKNNLKKIPEDQKEDYSLTPKDIEDYVKSIEKSILFVKKPPYFGFIVFCPSNFNDFDHVKLLLGPLFMKNNIKVINETNRTLNSHSG